MSFGHRLTALSHLPWYSQEYGLKNTMDPLIDVIYVGVKHARYGEIPEGEGLEPQDQTKAAMLEEREKFVIREGRLYQLQVRRLNGSRSALMAELPTQTTSVLSSTSLSCMQRWCLDYCALCLSIGSWDFGHVGGICSFLSLGIHCCGAYQQHIL